MENLFCRCVTCFETNWMNNFNFFEYLLLMSLRVENYKLVIRQYLYWLLDQLNEDCDCFNCKYCIILKTIKAELWKNNFGTFNKSIEWWRISETSTTLTVRPEIDESWVWEFFFSLHKIRLIVHLKLRTCCSYQRKWLIRIVL